GEPIATALVGLDLSGTVIFTTFTDLEGIYRIRGIAPGSYTIQAKAKDYEADHQGVIISANQVATANFSLQSDPGLLVGTVSDDSSGLPIAGALVEVNVNNVLVFSTHTDSAGNYLIVGIAPGAYNIQVHEENYQTDIKGALIESDQTTNLNFALIA